MQPKMNSSRYRGGFCRNKYPMSIYTLCVYYTLYSSCYIGTCYPLLPIRCLPWKSDVKITQNPFLLSKDVFVIDGGKVVRKGEFVT